MKRAALLTLLVSLVVPIVAGCGNSGGGAPRPQALTADGVSRYRQGSPERAAIEWWRDVQYANVGDLPGRYAPEVKVTGEDLQEQLPPVRPFFESTPRVDSVVERGDTATVYVLAFPQRGGRQVEAVAVRLKKRSGEGWELADNLLIEQLRRDSASRRAASRDTTERAGQRDEQERREEGERRERAERRQEREQRQGPAPPTSP